MSGDDIFDDFELTEEEKKKIMEQREKEKIEETPQHESRKETTFTDKPKDTYAKPKGSSKKVQAVIGLSLFAGVGVLLFLALTGMIDVVNDEPFNANQCQFGVKSGFFEDRCMTEDEFITAEGFEEINSQSEKSVTPTTPTTPVKQVPTEPIKQVPSSTTKNVVGYYTITTSDSWYGDYIDGSEIPKKIESNERAKIEFSCYTDDHLGTSVYFGTFRNNVEEDLIVQVYINGQEADSKTTDSNKALILEGSCIKQ